MSDQNAKGTQIYKSPGEALGATRDWFADNARACIKAASEGKWHVNDLPRYIAQQNQRIEDSLSGAYDHSLAFVQRAQYIQTGVSVPLL